MARLSWGCVLTVLPLWLHVTGVLGAFPMVEDPTGDHGYVKWPNRKIQFCYETPAAREKYHTDLMDAWEIWLAAGLNAAFTLTELDYQACEARHNDTMLIYDSDVRVGNAPTSYLATVPGFLGPKHKSRRAPGALPRYNRPIMALTNRDDIGLLNPVLNYAHEWGHAWGLYHEHQNPNFWGGVIGAKSGKVFGYGNKVSYDGGKIDNWQCKNLKDYPDLLDRLNGPRNPKNIKADDVCRAQSFSAQARFSGYDYLPFREHIAQGSTGHKATSVDWESMMMYNSKSGGSGNAVHGDDQRLPILLKPDGTLIPFNNFPNPRDIEALEMLYGLRKVEKTLLQMLGGATSSKFNSLFSKSKGGSSTSSCL